MKKRVILSKVKVVAKITKRGSFMVMFLVRYLMEVCVNKEGLLGSKLADFEGEMAWRMRLVRV